MSFISYLTGSKQIEQKFEDLGITNWVEDGSQDAIILEYFNDEGSVLFTVYEHPEYLEKEGGIVISSMDISDEQADLLLDVIEQYQVYSGKDIFYLPVFSNPEIEDSLLRVTVGNNKETIYFVPFLKDNSEYQKLIEDLAFTLKFVEPDFKKLPEIEPFYRYFIKAFNNAEELCFSVMEEVRGARSTAIIEEKGYFIIDENLRRFLIRIIDHYNDESHDDDDYTFRSRVLFDLKNT